MPLFVLIAAVLVVFVAIGVIVMKDALERQPRIFRMKRFRREAQARHRD